MITCLTILKKEMNKIQVDTFDYFWNYLNLRGITVSSNTVYDLILSVNLTIQNYLDEVEYLQNFYGKKWYNHLLAIVKPEINIEFGEACFFFMFSIGVWFYFNSYSLSKDAYDKESQIIDKEYQELCKMIEDWNLLKLNET